MLARDRDTERLHGRRIRRGRARIAPGHETARVDGEDRGRARPGTCGSDDVDPFHRPDRTSGSGGLEAGTHPVCGGRADPLPLAISARSRRSTRSSSAAEALRRLLSERAPSHTNRRTSVPSAVAAATYVSPTGFWAVPPSGPAIPVTDTARSAPVRRRPPTAIAIATWAETAPCAARTSSPTPTASRFCASEYVTKPPR